MIISILKIRKRNSFRGLPKAIQQGNGAANLQNPDLCECRISRLCYLLTTSEAKLCPDNAG